jgi:hypothetical protein
MSLYHKYNNEDILIRAVLAGLLDILNNQIKYKQVWGDEEVETISVPWFYNQSGDERFNQDFYTHYAECMPPRPIDGNFDVVPRGVITYTGSGINAQRITSRYVQGRYVKEVDGQLQSYVSYLYSMPLTVRIDCEMRIDRQITALKIEQEIREVFYKTVTYYSYFKGMRIGSTVGFPEDITIDKNIQYSFEANNPIKITFQLEIETYQPVFDPTTEMKTTSRMKGIGYNLYPVPEKPNLNTITIRTPQEGAIIPKGIPIWIEWSANSKGIIINRVDLQWCYYQQNDFTDIELMVPNHEYYIWNIPESFTAYKEPVMIWEEDVDKQVSRKPVVKIIPDLVTKVIDSSSFQIFDEGYFIVGSDDASMNIQLEMKDDAGNISYSNDGAIWANIKYDVLHSITVNDPSLIFPGTVDYKHIDIHVSSGNESQVVGILNNIKIV